MRRKTSAETVTPGGAQGNANISVKIEKIEDTPFKLMKLTGRPTKTPAGKGLGKAGAKRLGRLLKRAIIQDPEESAGEGKESLPKTPVRLFKYQIQNEAENAPKTNTAPLASPPHVSQLILSVVSQCKHRGGITMAELKQTLAAGGYDVTKNNRRVNVVTNRLVNNETLVRTTRNVSFRLNNKKAAVTTHLRTSAMKCPQKEDLKLIKTARNPPQEARKSQRQAKKTPRAAAKSQKLKAKTHKPAAKSQKPKSKTHKPAAKSQKLKAKTHKPAAKSQKLKGETHKPAAKSQKPQSKTRKPAAKSYRPRRKTPKVRRKMLKPAGRTRRSVKNQATRVQKSPRKDQRARRHGTKQNLYPYKYSRRRQQPKRRLLKMRLRTRQRRVSRRRAYY